MHVVALLAECFLSYSTGYSEVGACLPMHSHPVHPHWNLKARDHNLLALWFNDIYRRSQGHFAPCPKRIQHIAPLQMLEWANEYGGIYKFCLGAQYVIVVSDPAIATQVGDMSLPDSAARAGYSRHGFTVGFRVGSREGSVSEGNPSQESSESMDAGWRWTDLDRAQVGKTKKNGWKERGG